ncbi:MAG: hypothetical protein OXU42_12700 [Deltaproteobacteria bacterium]|nr:hypothetical protein [Deltaproteobacteria bacterium]
MLGDWISGHAVTLFDPEQSFGKGTNTDLERNQVQVRRAYVLFGNLDRTPFFASIGKMAVPFGLTDTVNPFTASTVWHAFGAPRARPARCRSRRVASLPVRSSPPVLARRRSPVRRDPEPSRVLDRRDGHDGERESRAYRDLLALDPDG